MRRSPSPDRRDQAQRHRALVDAVALGLQLAGEQADEPELGAKAGEGIAVQRRSTVEGPGALRVQSSPGFYRFRMGDGAEVLPIDLVAKSADDTIIDGHDRERGVRDAAAKDAGSCGSVLTTRHRMVAGQEIME